MIFASCAMTILYTPVTPVVAMALYQQNLIVGALQFNSLGWFERCSSLTGMSQ